MLVDELKDDLDARIAALDPAADSILLEGLPAGQPPVSATPAGLATVGIGLLENLSSNRAELTYLALCLAGLWLVLRLRSLSRALLALVPVFLAVGTSSLIVALLGIQLSPLTTVSGPLVIATCTEFSVLIFGRYLEENPTRPFELSLEAVNGTVVGDVYSTLHLELAPKGRVQGNVFYATVEMAAGSEVNGSLTPLQENEPTTEKVPDPSVEVSEAGAAGGHEPSSAKVD